MTREIRIQYPENWEELKDKDKIKKSEEIGIASFFLNDEVVRNYFDDLNQINLICSEEPDFYISSTQSPDNNIGLEVTKCYPVKGNNSQKIEQDLLNICKTELKVLSKKDEFKSILENVSCVHIIFAHQVLIDGCNESLELRKELSEFIYNKDKRNGKFISSVRFEKQAFGQSDIDVSIESDMAFLVSSISDVVKIKAKMGLENPDPILQCIETKSQKLDKYKLKAKSNIKEWWLCIDIPANAYMTPRNYQLPKGFESEFDLIVLTKRACFGFGNFVIYHKKKH